MDILDIVALSGLEWVYDKVEDRHGRAAAWLVTLTLAAAMLAAIVAVVMAVI
ncbi:MAG TPA: hypothetical protein VM531_12380 [Sphingomicrobium sp.]|jgi:hypothetical protein|nr:hypothetical protein [Sphingomicrobium sp.]